MHVRRWALGGMAVLGLLAVVGSVQAQELLLDAHLSSSTDFPNSLTFSVEATTPVVVDHAEVHYHVEQQSCGTGDSIGTVSITPTDSPNVSWTWNLRSAGGIPVGSRVTFYWVLSGNGGTFETQPKTIVYEDPRYDWQSLTGQHMVLHWYYGSQSFAQDLLNAGEAGILKLQQATGVVPAEPVDVRIYDSAQAMQDTVLFGQEWAGGIAYPRQRLVAIGVNPANIDWGRDAMVHEMTHVVIGQATFRCGSSLPSWLDEGLAVYNQAHEDPEFQQTLQSAIAKNAVYSLRTIAGAFPSDRDAAVLAYAQSRDVVAFLINTYGADKMNELLASFKSLGTIDRALTQVYGFDTDGLDAEWRTHLGLPPRQAPSTIESVPLPTIPAFGIPTPQGEASPTPIPGASAPTPSPSPTATATPTATPTPIPSGGFGCNRSPASAGIDGGLILAFALGGFVMARRRL